MVIKVLIVLALYFLIGELLFSVVLTLLGGKEAFKKDMGDDEHEANLVYVACHLSIIILWPVFLIGRMVNGKKEDK